MKKHLISITNRQDLVYKNLSKELELSFSELVRRSLDEYIESRVKNGILVRFTWTDGKSGKSIYMESPKEIFKKLYDYVKANPSEAITLSE